MYIAVLFKAHILNYALCNYIKKIYNECNNYNINQTNHFLIFQLLIPDNLTYKIPDEFKEFTPSMFKVPPSSRNTTPSKT